MKCCQCEKEVDEETFEHMKSLPPMVGYNCPAHELHVVECAQCRQPVCGDCIQGHGFFTFTCKGKCTKDFAESIKPK